MKGYNTLKMVFGLKENNKIIKVGYSTHQDENLHDRSRRREVDRHIMKNIDLDPPRICQGLTLELDAIAWP